MSSAPETQAIKKVYFHHHTIANCKESAISLFEKSTAMKMNCISGQNDK